MENTINNKITSTYHIVENTQLSECNENTVGLEVAKYKLYTHLRCRNVSFVGTKRMRLILTNFRGKFHENAHRGRYTYFRMFS